MAKRTKNVNLVVEGSRGNLAVAKAVTLPADFGRRRIVHATVHSNYVRQSTQSWGVRFPVLLYMVEQEIKDLYLYNPDRDVTYYTDVEQIIAKGTPGKRDQYGETLNVPISAWATFPGKLPVAHVPDEQQVVCPSGDFSVLPQLEQWAEVPADDRWVYTDEVRAKIAEAEERTQQLRLFE